MKSIVNSYKRVWNCVGIFTNWHRDLGIARRTAVGILKTIDLAVVPFRPNGTYFESLRLEIVKGQNISANNIINQIFSIESQMCTSQDLAFAYNILSNMVARVKENTIEGMSPLDKMALLDKTIKNAGLEWSKTKGQLFVEGLLSSKIDCVVYSFIALAVAQELDWPVRLVSVPSHIFIRWEEKDVKMNVEFGKIVPDEYYINRFYITRISTLDHNGIIAQALFRRGHVKKRLKQYTQAIADLDEAIKLDPLSADIYLARADAKQLLGQYAEAIVDCNEAIKLNPKYAAAFYFRGRFKDKLGQGASAIADYQEALAKINEAIKLNPGYIHALLERAQIRSLLGQYAGAILDCDEVIKLNPTDTEYAVRLINKISERWRRASANK